MTRADFDVSEDTVERAEKALAQLYALEQHKHRKDVKILSFDEIAIRKGHNDVTVFTNYETFDVIGVADGRKAENLRPFFEALGSTVCSEIEAACIDMSKAYIKAVKDYLPNAEIVFDRFHVVKLLNETLSKVRLSEKKKSGEENKELWHGSRHVLGKNKQDLDDEQRQKLKALCEHSSTIATAYQLKEAFRTLWEKQTLRGAKAFLTRWLSKARAR